MFKYLRNNKGAALLSVMVILSVLVVVGSIVLTISSSESRMVYDYGNNIRAYYIAEAGADLAIKKWKDYINRLLEETEEGAVVLSKDADTGEYLDVLDNNKEILTAEISNGYGLKAGSSSVRIDYPLSIKPDELAPTKPGADPVFFTLKTTGTYEHAVYEYEIRLWYFEDGRIGSQKGTGSEPEPPEPPGDSEAPVVERTDPTGEQVEVPVTKTIEIIFSEPVWEGNAFNDIAIVDGIGSTINFNESISGANLVLNPVTSLGYGTTYTVTIPAGAVEDAEGNPLKNEYSFSFTTTQPAAVNFDGDHWLGPPAEILHGNWDIEQAGRIISHQQTPPNYAYYSGKKYQDFTMEVSVSANDNGNNEKQPEGYIGLLYFYNRQITGKKDFEDQGNFFGIDMNTDLNKIVTGTLENGELSDKQYYDSIYGLPERFIKNSEYSLKVAAANGIIKLFVENIEVTEVPMGELLSDEFNDGYIGVYESVGQSEDGNSSNDNGNSFTVKFDFN